MYSALAAAENNAVFIVFLPLIEILTKIINHTNKETVYNPLPGKKPVIFASWVSPNIWLRLFNTHNH
jgi:hypothetical protein